MVQSEATGIFLRIPTPIAHGSSKSAITLANGGSSRSSSCSRGPSIFVKIASLKPPKSTAFARSMMLGMEAKRMLSGLGSEPMQPSHSSVTTKVMRRLCFLEDNILQRLIMALIWPCSGKGTATTWQTMLGSAPVGSIMILKN